MQDAYSFMLDFPNEAQPSACKKPSYLSLSNSREAYPDYPIYQTGPPVTNPCYPYPARNVLNPNTYPSSTPLLASNGRHPSKPEDSAHPNRRADIPSSYHFMPQPVHIETYSQRGYQVGVKFPPIQFQCQGGAPYTVQELLKLKSLPDLVDGNDKVFGKHGDRMIKIKIIWPGYTQYPFEKRVWTTGGDLTRNLLLVKVAKYIDEFAKFIYKMNVPVEYGQEYWAVKWKGDESRTLWKDCIITSLHHCSGSVWQPEIYYLRN